MATNVTRTGNEVSWLEVVRSIVADIGEIVRSEVRLGAIEIKEQAQAAGRASVPILVGAVFSVYALGFVLLCAMFALGLVLPRWLAALIIGVLTAVTGGILIGFGTWKLRQTSMKPVRTIQSAKETLQWAKNRSS